MSTKRFIPNEKQIELLKVMIDGQIKPTITAYCEEVGIDRKTYYNWFDNDAFVEWFDKEWERAMKRKISWLDRVALSKAPSDFRYWEALKMEYGKLRRKSDVTTDNEKLDAGIFIIPPTNEDA